MSKSIDKNKARLIITVTSIVIPLVVALLFNVKLEVSLPVFLPPIYATINALTALVLIVAVRSVIKGNRDLHQKLMTFAMILSLLFLVMYVLHHMTSDSVRYEGDFRLLYLVILFSHILLSVAVIPLVLTTYLRGYLGEFDRHRKIAKITFPIWLYVAITGVVVYLMIAPYYS
jgi:putative membrane protein